MVTGRDMKQKGVAIQLDKERHLVYDLNAFCDIEDEYGNIGAAMESLENGSSKAIRKLLHVGLLHEDPTLEERKVGSFISFANLRDASMKIGEAIFAAMPAAEEGEEKN